MKQRFFAALLTLLLCLPAVCPVLAAEPAESETAAPPYASAAELYESWYAQNPGESFPYPDCINGVWSVDGTMEHLCFSLVKGTPESEKEALLALIADKDSLCFVEGSSRTMRELLKIQDAITERMSAEDGIYAVCLLETAGKIEVEADSAVLQALREELTAQYGDAVLVTAGSPFEFMTGTADASGTLRVPDDPEIPGSVRYAVPLRPSPGQSTPSGRPWLWAAAALGVLLPAGTAWFLLRRRRLCPAEGELPAPTARWTKRRVEAAVRGAAAVPDPKLRDAILDAAKRIP